MAQQMSTESTTALGLAAGRQLEPFLNSFVGFLLGHGPNPDESIREIQIRSQRGNRVQCSLGKFGGGSISDCPSRCQSKGAKSMTSGRGPRSCFDHLPSTEFFRPSKYPAVSR